VLDETTSMAFSAEQPEPWLLWLLDTKRRCLQLMAPGTQLSLLSALLSALLLLPMPPCSSCLRSNALSAVSLTESAATAAVADAAVRVLDIPQLLLQLQQRQLPHPLAHALHVDHIVAAEVLLDVLVHILPPCNQRLHQMPQVVLRQQPDTLQSRQQESRKVTQTNSMSHAVYGVITRTCAQAETLVEALSNATASTKYVLQAIANHVDRVAACHRLTWSARS
jgi:hypothetical protein